MKAGNRSAKPDWEILPQAAKPGAVILCERNALGITFEFRPRSFIFHGVRYASVAKTLRCPHTRAEVAQITAFEAEAAGDTGENNMRRIGIDWVTFEGKRMPYRSMTKG